MSLLAKALWWNGPLLVIELLALSTGMIRLRGPRRIDNIPFANPVTVASIDETSMTLTDGRTITPAGGLDGLLREEIRRSKGILGLEADPDRADGVLISVRRPRLICGTCEGLIVIPLSRYDWPRYTAEFAREGTIQNPGH